jgi:hypothetical protein
MSIVTTVTLIVGLVDRQVRMVHRCGAWSYPGAASWDMKLDKPDGRQCALDAGHQGNHELVGWWTRGDYPGDKR